MVKITMLLLTYLNPNVHGLPHLWLFFGCTRYLDTDFFFFLLCTGIHYACDFERYKENHHKLDWRCIRHTWRDCRCIRHLLMGHPSRRNTLNAGASHQRLLWWHIHTRWSSLHQSWSHRRKLVLKNGNIKNKYSENINKWNTFPHKFTMLWLKKKVNTDCKSKSSNNKTKASVKCFIVKCFIVKKWRTFTYIHVQLIWTVWAGIVKCRLGNWYLVYLVNDVWSLVIKFQPNLRSEINSTKSQPRF